MPVLTILLVFLLICARYAVSIELWGDEAFSLLCASRDWHQMFQFCDAHLPTYYDLQLRPLVQALSLKSELALRMLHALVFAIGIGFCWLIGREQLRNRTLLLGMMISTILLPNYIFYAVNIRMYALLFACSMAFIWASFKMLASGRIPMKSKVIYLLTGLAVSLVDYPGIFLFAITTAFLIAINRADKLSRRSQLFIFWASIFLVFLSGFLFRDELQKVMQWPGFSSMALAGGGVRSLLKFSFFAIRPLLDLVYPPTSALALNIYLWIVIALALAWSFASLIRQGGRENHLLVFFASYWLILSPFGLAFTRVALPAQFFAMLAIFLAVQRALSARRKWIALWLVISLLSIIIFNLEQAIFPTIRLYSRIPFEQIARDAAAVARQKDIGVIAISRHTLNALSVERHLRPMVDPETKVVLLDPKPTCGSFPRQRFIYIQLMPEDGEDSDPGEACEGSRIVGIKNIENYVDFSTLGYNKLWIGTLSDKVGDSSFAASLAEVNIQ